MIIDRCLSFHRLDSMNKSTSDERIGMDIEKGLIIPPLNMRNDTHHGLTSSPYQYGSTNSTMEKVGKTLRFQIVVWYVGPLDVLQGQVKVKFRVTLFWNDDKEDEKYFEPTDSVEGIEEKYVETKELFMRGRHSASERITHEPEHSIIDVPAISILNAVSFDVLGDPNGDISCLSQRTKLMRWTCLYSAVLFQSDLRVDNFPHDSHDLVIKIGILSGRSSGGRWDSSVWKLALATEKDTKGTTRVPEGLMVDHVKIPGFSHDNSKCLQFSFVPLDYGCERNCRMNDEKCLLVKIKVNRESSYYDWNIIPLLITLDIVAICVLCQNANDFFQRGLMLLNTAFLEIGMRMSLDDRLPRVGYQIKLQSILSHYFFKLLALTIESAFLYYLIKYRDWTVHDTNIIDASVAIFSLIHASILMHIYYRDRKPRSAKG
eukprot:CAMPEP_0184863224 /NCGR_PEP_ID=MMETSP0580-20130426/9835_1 /TAXON_ID=1118495 /ORGANISM="Dactyliosolen fragilissimus" /LENGTH=430 /DNA_ID=CAMNT_0027361421 /DNA_START=85 /DNA_END=1374 /DNA_ORIENTATION=-